MNSVSASSLRFNATIRASGLIVLLLCAVNVIAQTVEVFDMITAGLPSNTVRAIHAVEEDDVWVGTDWGLCHFDGVDWEVFQVGGSPLPDNDIRSLSVDDLGRVWIGTFTQGIAVKDGMNWTFYTTQNSDLPDDHVRVIHIDHAGILWIGTGGGLARFDGTDWRVYDETPASYNGLQLPSPNITDVVVRPDDVVFLGTVNGGSIYLTDSTMTVYNTFDSGLPDNTAAGIAIDAAGDRWAACPAGALLRHAGPYLGGVWNQYSTLNSFIPTNSLSDIAIDSQDRRVIGTQIAGISIFQGLNTWSNYTTNNSDLPDNEILVVALDPADAIWAGTLTGGAVRIRSSVGIDEYPNARQLHVYPSPCAGDLNVEFKDEQASGWSITDITGRVVLAGPVVHQGRSTVDTSGLSVGRYHVTVVFKDGRSATRAFSRG